MMNQKDAANEGQSTESQIYEVGEVSPHNKAVYEAGKALLIESINTGREFCKFMISTSISAIPIYIGILTFILPEGYNPSTQEKIIGVIPAIVFLIAAILFVVGYLPVISRFSLDIIEEIEKERSKAIRHRGKLIKAGFSLFIAGTFAALMVLILNLGSR
jgi:uncharacterized membrane protein YbhN (UPF0104 family)